MAWHQNLNDLVRKGRMDSDEDVPRKGGNHPDYMKRNDSSDRSIVQEETPQKYGSLE